jgi:predicted secreted hydrolase
MRRLLAIPILALCLCGASALAATTPQVHFPRDHFGHPGSSIEWWYFTGVVHDAAGHRYSVFFTLFARQGLVVPVAQVLDLRSGKLIGHAEAVGIGAPTATAVDVTAAGSQLRYLAGTDTWNVTVQTPKLAFTLSQHPDKPYVLHGGGTGVIRQSFGGVSHYYSDTRLAVKGTLRIGGKRVAVTGESWFDHQWGDYEADPRAFNWNWFSCRFDDGTELMLYEFRDRKTGKPLPQFRNGTFVDRKGHGTSVTDFTAAAQGEPYHAAGHSWPLDWTLHAAAPKLDERVRALFADQLVRNGIVPTFWEGAARATGTHPGTCFVEISYR